jgi:hypothetical protein
MSAIPNIQIYTSNYYTLTGAFVKFDNLCSNLDDTTGLTIESEGQSIFLNNNQKTNSFSFSYSTPGVKTVSITPRVNFTPPPTATVFEDIVFVLPEYDIVSPLNYATTDTDLDLPWPECPQIGLNEIGVADNINNCLKKFYDNLNYLKIRANVYFVGTAKYYGQLTAPSSLVVTQPFTYRKLGFRTFQYWKNKDTAWDEVLCDSLPTRIWKVDIMGLNAGLTTFAPNTTNSFTYTGIAAKNNILYVAEKDNFSIFTANLTATRFVNATTLNPLYNFKNIKNICLDSKSNIYVLDSDIPQVAAYNYRTGTPGADLALIASWGRLGTSITKDGFYEPNDIHIDQFDTVWICDTGNNVIKHYTSTGGWLKTISDSFFETFPPLSLCVDSETNIHVLTRRNIRVYSYEGEFLRSYNFRRNLPTNRQPQRINSSYNREIIYVASSREVIKYFRNGIFAGPVTRTYTNITNITNIFHDEFRNLYVVSNDKLFKVADIMALAPLADVLPSYYWTFDQIQIGENEYVQSWVYNSAFQKIWDNIEIFRNILYYTSTSSSNQRGYKAPKYSKADIIIGQNEIVAASVVNRVLKYLWTNLYSVVQFFSPPDLRTIDDALTFESGNTPDPEPPLSLPRW